MSDPVFLILVLSSGEDRSDVKAAEEHGSPALSSGPMGVFSIQNPDYRQPILSSSGVVRIYLYTCIYIYIYLITSYIYIFCVIIRHFILLNLCHRIAFPTRMWNPTTEASWLPMELILS